MTRYASIVLAFALACNTPPSSDEAKAAPKTATPAAQADTSGPVASVADKTFTLADVDKAGAAGVIKARIDLYEARRMAADQLVHEYMFELEAKAAGTDVEGWLKAEVEAKITPVTDAEIEQFFNENRSQMRGAPLDAVKPQIKGYLENQRKQERLMALVTELKKKHKVSISLEPPRIDVEAGDSPRYGNADAPVEIIEFSDFQCPYCTKGADTITKVKEKYGDKVTVVYRHFPLDFHPHAAKAAEASECANEQGKFWEFHDQLFAHQSALQVENLSGYAKEAGLDAAAFETCLSSGKHAETVKQDLEDGANAGMSGTPGFYINGRFVGGAQPLEVFSEIIDDELSRNG